MKKLIIILAILCLCFPSHAATMDDIRAEGKYTLEEWSLATIGRIPVQVVKLHQLKGGRVTFVEGPLEKKFDYYEPTILGLYHFRSKHIYVRVWHDVDRGYGRILAHEYGHFLYHETYASWPSWVKECIRNYCPEDSDESFAETYAKYCSYGSLWASDLTAAVEEINRTADRLYKKTAGLE